MLKKTSLVLIKTTTETTQTFSAPRVTFKILSGNDLAPERDAVYFKGMEGWMQVLQDFLSHTICNGHAAISLRNTPLRIFANHSQFSPKKPHM
jgi:hypothetical protein